MVKYNKAFADLPYLSTPKERKGVFSAFHLYVVQIDFEKMGKSRKQIFWELRKEMIDTQVHYNLVHEQPYYRMNYGCKHGDLPISELYYQRALSLPLYPKMTNADVAHVIAKVLAICKPEVKGAHK